MSKAIKLIVTVEVTVTQMSERTWRSRTKKEYGHPYVLPDEKGIISEVRTMLKDRLESDEYCIIDWPSDGGTSVACQGISVIAVGMKG